MTTDPSTKIDRRTTLLAAGRAILAEKGFEATTISEIVARAGVAQGTFYLYFPSKVGLVTALLQELDERILGAVREATTNADTAAEVVEAGIVAVFKQIEQYRDILTILHSHSMFAQNIRERGQHLVAYHSLIATLIRQRQATGEVGSEVNPEIAAGLIAGLIDHAADECYIYHPQPPEAYMVEVIRFVRHALNIS